MKLTEFDISNPYKARVVSSERISGDEANEVRHIVKNIAEATFHYTEGQSMGVLVGGRHAFGDREHFRLYSIASARQGEDRNMTEISLCVRRCHYIDDVNGERYPGVASNYLCSHKPGDLIKITGPYGRHFLPPRDNSCNLLMIGVGTGIVPFRAFIKHIYDERKEWRGQVRGPSSIMPAMCGAYCRTPKPLCMFQACRAWKMRWIKHSSNLSDRQKSGNKPKHRL